MTTGIDIRTGMRMTLDEFLNLPEMEQRIELHDGVLYVMPQANFNHQNLGKMLTHYLTAQIELEGLGVVLPPIDVVLFDNTTVAPDIVVVRSGRVDIMHDLRFHGAPDIVVEVLSSDRSRDLVDKRRLYEIAGIPEYWILDGDADTLTSLELGDDGIYRERAVLTAADTLTTPLFPTISLPLRLLFNNPARIRR